MNVQSLPFLAEAAHWRQGTAVSPALASWRRLACKSMAKATTRSKPCFGKKHAPTLEDDTSASRILQVSEQMRVRRISLSVKAVARTEAHSGRLQVRSNLSRSICCSQAVLIPARPSAGGSEQLRTFTRDADDNPEVRQSLRNRKPDGGVANSVFFPGLGEFPEIISISRPTA